MERRNENNENGSDRRNIYIRPLVFSPDSRVAGTRVQHGWHNRFPYANERVTRARTFQVLRPDSFSFPPGTRFFTGRQFRELAACCFANRDR